jgi:plastocyanin
MRRSGVLECALLLSLAAPVLGAAELEVIVSSRGFRPAEITVRKGETLKVHLTSADREHCFAVDALRIEKRVLPGKRTPVEIVADRAGTFAFHCCLEPDNEAQRGRVVVSE